MAPPKKNAEKDGGVPFARTLQAAKTLYTHEMDKMSAMAGTTKLSSGQLQENHDRVSTIALEQVKLKVPQLTSGEEKLLRTTFDDLFKKIEENNLKDRVNSPAIGIDLGTTYSCVAIYQDGKVTVIPNELGARTTPSYVAFDDAGNILIGDPAKFHTNINPDERIYDVKRLIGRSYDDPIVQEDIKLWPFQVVSDDNTPKIKIRGRTFYPEQISAKILASLKKQAEEYLGQENLVNAVITVPAYFNDGQRQATKDAGTIAGLNVLRIINEPTAAAIAYSHQLDPKSQKNILVFDLGGGTFDVALLTMDRGYISVKAVGGDTHLGGEDFDHSMVEHCIKEFKAKKGVDLAEAKNSPDLEIRSKAARCLRRLKNECEQQKRNLSAARVVPVSLEAIYDDHDLHVRFTRDLFNNLNMETFQKCVLILEQVLEDANLKKEQVDDVVLVGGSSRIPKIREMIEKFFNGKQLCKAINPDEAVAHGAALQAALMSFNEGEGPQPTNESGDGGGKDTWHVQISDVIPLPVGIKIFVEEGRLDDFSVILPKNTNVPCGQKKRYYTIEDCQKEVEICVYEGVHKSVAENHLLGSFLLQNLPPNALKGEPIDVNIQINSEGILHVTAECPATRSMSEIVVDEFKKRLKPEDVVNIFMEELFLSLAANVPF